MSEKRRGNPVGAGTQNVPVNMPIEMANKLSEMAAACGMSRGSFCRVILEDYMRRGASVAVRHEVSFHTSQIDAHQGSRPPSEQGTVEKAFGKAVSAVVGSVRKSPKQ